MISARTGSSMSRTFTRLWRRGISVSANARFYRGRPAADAHCQAWARATNDRGEQVEAWLETGEGFAFTAAAAARAVAVIRRKPTAGAHAAATVLGDGFVDSLPDVRVSVNASLEVAS